MSAPLIFDYELRQNSRFRRKDKRGRWLVLKNRSTRTISRFAFGCSVNKGGKVKALGPVGFSFDSQVQKPGEFVEAFLDSNPIENEKFGKSLCVTGQLTVMKAMFKDGSSWSADGVDWVEAER